MTTTTFLAESDFVVNIFASVAVLSVAFRAYWRTKMLPFAFFIWGSFLNILLYAGIHVRGDRGFINVQEHQAFLDFCRVPHIAVNVLWAAGVVTLVRHYLKLADRKDDHVA